MVSFLADIMKNLVAVISLVFVCFSDGASGFEFEDCAPKSKVLLIKKLEVTPHPIIVAENVTASALFWVTEDVYPNATVKVEITRIKPDSILPEYKVPCYKTFGSCTFNASSYFELQQEVVCQFFSKREDCKFPLKTGMYQGDNISISLPLLEEFGYLAETGAAKELVPTSKKQLFCRFTNRHKRWKRNHWPAD